MAIRIAVGDESFDEIRKAGLYYVDKTELLYDLAGLTHNKVTLLTRPRRFGKTLGMSMMESFFDINRNSRAVFEGLDNSRQRELMTAFWDEDIAGAEKLLGDFLWDTISYHDYHEDYYHAFMAGLFVGLGYSVDSNKESGLGRFDIRARDRRNAVP